jgi:hypothetical protein
VQARHAGGLVDREIGGPRERQRYAAQRGAALAVRPKIERTSGALGDDVVQQPVTRRDLIN